ncbi:MAG: tRNA (adenosine(37)-N6)-threonylcarbamoyltransferase complex dimerization subunit type 1 TsaB [Eubacterium sp.]|nr:tRNA (adenosine(37)-N6)-threonylcarbamoyltransferase complex dimerization subunit type 1 TsaB [Eubacterium sp.]
MILGIDTSTAACCAAVYDTGRRQFVARYEINNKLTHSVTLMPMIENMLASCGCTLQDIDLVAACAGPGSFTGIRIGVSAAKGLAAGLDILCAAVTSCEAAAYSLPVRRGVICAAIDAKINRVYCALFRADGDRLERLTDEQCITAEQAAKLLSEYKNEDITVTGDGAQIIADALGELSGAVTVIPQWAAQQSACGVCLAAQYAEAVTPEKIMPVYIQLPQAQRELEEKLKGK